MLIGIAGHARHGKDSTADIIIKHYGMHKVAFADPMKKAVLAAFPKWDDRHVNGDLKDVVCPIYGIKPRSALKSIGDAWGRGDLLNYDNFADVTGLELWIRAAIDRGGENCIFSDVRRINEWKVLKEHGAIIIMVKRDWPVDMSHPSESEVELIQADYIINNRGTLTDLEWMVCKMMDQIIN